MKYFSRRCPSSTNLRQQMANQPNSGIGSVPSSRRSSLRPASPVSKSPSARRGSAVLFDSKTPPSVLRWELLHRVLAFSLKGDWSAVDQHLSQLEKNRLELSEIEVFTAPWYFYLRWYGLIAYCVDRIAKGYFSTSTMVHYSFFHNLYTIALSVYYLKAAHFPLSVNDVFFLSPKIWILFFLEFVSSGKEQWQFSFPARSHFPFMMLHCVFSSFKTASCVNEFFGIDIKENDQANRAICVSNESGSMQISVF